MDALSVRFTSEVDAYLCVFYKKDDGKAFQVQLNVHHSDNRVPARQT